jgi:hypothetical protein
MTLLAAPVAMAAVTSGAGRDLREDLGAARSRLVHFGGALAGGLFAAWVPSLAWTWDSLASAPSGGAGPGGLGPGWVLARSLEDGLAGWLLGSGRPLVLVAAVLPAVVWVRRRPRRAYAAVGRLGGLGGGQRPVALVSLRVALGLPDRGTEGGSWSWPPAVGRSASWSTRWSGSCATTPRPACPRAPAPAGT